MKPKRTIFLLCVLSECQSRTLTRVAEGDHSSGYVSNAAPQDPILNWSGVFKIADVFEKALRVVPRNIPDNPIDAASVFVAALESDDLPEWAEPADDVEILIENELSKDPRELTFEKLSEFLNKSGIVTVKSLRRGHRNMRRKEKSNDAEGTEDSAEGGVGTIFGSEESETAYNELQDRVGEFGDEIISDGYEVDDREDSPKSDKDFEGSDGGPLPEDD